MNSIFRELKRRKVYRVALGSDPRFDALVAKTASPKNGSTR